MPADAPCGPLKPYETQRNPTKPNEMQPKRNEMQAKRNETRAIRSVPFAGQNHRKSLCIRLLKQIRSRRKARNQALRGLPFPAGIET